MKLAAQVAFRFGHVLAFGAECAPHFDMVGDVVLLLENEIFVAEVFVRRFDDGDFPMPLRLPRLLMLYDCAIGFIANRQLQLLRRVDVGNVNALC